MKKFTRLLFGSSFSVALVAVAGCSSNSDSNTGTPDGSTSTTTTTTATSTTPTSSTTSTTTTATNITVPPAGAPSAVTDLELTIEGPNSMSIKWTAATAGTNAIDHYNIYRNGVSYATAPATATTYTDSAATNATVTGAGNANNPQSAATVYSYNVTAVDSASLEGPQAAQMTAWWYRNGTFSGGGEYSNPSGANIDVLQGENNGTQTTTNWCSTGVASSTGAPCVAYVTSTQYWQPYSGGTISPEYAMDIGGFNYLQLDINSTAAQQFVFAFFSRGPAGDIFNNITIDVNGTANAWQHVKIALTPTANATQNLGFGFGFGTGWFTGDTLNATAWTSGVKFEACTWITGPGVAANTMINQPNCAGCAGEAGSSTGLVQTGGYEVTTTQTLGSTAAPINLTLQRTNAYKLHVEAKGNAPYYVDNLAFTLN